MAKRKIKRDTSGIPRRSSDIPDDPDSLRKFIFLDPAEHVSKAASAEKEAKSDDFARGIIRDASIEDVNRLDLEKDNVTKVNIDYQPFEKQIMVHQAFDSYRTRVMVTGARGGKTTCGVADAFDRAINQPGYDQVDIDNGEPYTICIGAPDFPMIERVILPAWQRKVPNALMVDPYHGTKHRMIIRGKRGLSFVYFLTCSRPESWQGLKLYGVWIDEFPLIKESMFDEARTRLSDKKGWLLLTGTPRGPNWAKKRLYDAYIEGTDDQIFFTTWKTIDNPYIDKKEIARLKATMPPKYFKRTFEASWDVFEGQIFEEFNESAHVFNPDEYRFILPSGRKAIGTGDNVIKLNRVIAGIDWGYGVDHPGCILVFGMGRNGVWYCLDESLGEQILVFSQNLSQDSWARRAQELRARWEVKMFFADSASPQNINMLKLIRLPVAPALKQVMDGIQAVADLLKIDELSGSTKLMFSNRCQAVLGEIVYYHWMPGKENPAKINDHAMDAMRYALHTYNVRGVFQREKNYTPR